MELTTATAHPHNRAVRRHLSLVLSVTAAFSHNVRPAIKDIRGMPRIEGVTQLPQARHRPKKPMSPKTRAAVSPMNTKTSI